MPAPIDSHPDHLFPRPIDRRHVLKAGAFMSAAAAAFGLPALAGARPQPPQPPVPPAPSASARAKNVIFMVADGMSMGTLALADTHRRLVDQRPSAWTNLWSSPGTRRALARTHSLDSLVTDSAAGGCAWGCGRHLNNGAVNVLPDGEQLIPILVSARSAGKKTGVVTTARVTHATPASFYANAPARDMEVPIAQQLLDRGIDIALGGGDKSFPKDMLDAAQGLEVVRNVHQLAAAAPNSRVLGLFDRSHVPFMLDRMPWIPSLVNMTTAALKHLECDNGFVLQIEAGRVDHAAHANDAAGLLSEQLEFDDAIAAVLEWLSVGDRARDTLLIITTDHANANPGLTLYGPAGAAGMANLRAAKGSFDKIGEALTSSRDPANALSRIRPAILDVSGYELTAAEQETLAKSFKGDSVFPFSGQDHWWCVLGSILADHYAVSFVSGNHTADYVEVTASGPGSHSINACIDNIDLHATMLNAMGIDVGPKLPDMHDKLKPRKEPKPD